MNKKFLKALSKIYLVFGIVLIFFAFSIIAITFYPQIWYSVSNTATETEAATIQEQLTEIEEYEPEEETKEPETTLPPLDTSLPKENVLRIASIGVDSEISQEPNADEGLEEGLWIVPDFGTPEINDLPIIIAAHRFGYVYWSSDFRQKSSFYNLPKLRVGDRVQIIWDQRSYEFEVYKAEDNTQITDYEADLILYTCRMYNSPIRVFRYLSRVN
ncbi:MAG: sortase [Candidatus Dojkabacteria bacterium]|jgi:sortase (surface protein transpeptidase)